MVKKLVLITAFVLFAGVLIAGAINRSQARAGEEVRHAEENSLAASGEDVRGPGSARQAAQDYGQGQGLGRQGNQNQAGSGALPTRGGAGRQAQEERAGAAQQPSVLTLAGTVAQAPAVGVDLVLETAEGSVQVGTGPGYLDKQGFTVGAGESIQVTGFWEDGEFKAVTITSQDGRSVALRDEWGRPYWRGSMRSGRAGNQSTS